MDQLSQQPVKPQPQRMGAPRLVLAKARPFRAGPPQPLAHAGFSVACESRSERLHSLPLPLLFPFLLLAYFKLLCSAVLVASPLHWQCLHLLVADRCALLLEFKLRLWVFPPPLQTHRHIPSTPCPWVGASLELRPLPSLGAGGWPPASG